jgi:hypothetical protein
LIVLYALPTSKPYRPLDDVISDYDSGDKCDWFHVPASSSHSVGIISLLLYRRLEQTKTPFLDYPRGTVYQPEEHSLDLSRAHVIELNDAFQRMAGQADYGRVA